jgi:hypothetical protein
VNAAVAAIAARRFEKAELYALVDSASGSSPHTIGRVWSSKRGEWLYFDAFYADAVIFTKDSTGSPRFLETDDPRVISRGEISRETYSMGGVRLSGFRSTFGRYLWTRLTEEKPPTFPPPLGPVAVGPPANPFPGRDDAVFRKVARAYAAARVEDLFGERPVEGYRKIAADPLCQRDERAWEIAVLARAMADADENVTQ